MNKQIKNKPILVICLIILLSFSSCSNEYPEHPPEGWKIVSNGKEYAFKSPNGAISLFPKDSYSAAVKAAWEQYNYGIERENQKKWDEVER
jgi:hypothetical protein